MKVLLADGSTGEVTEVRRQSDEIKVRLIDCPFGPRAVGQEEVCSAAEVMGFTSGEDLNQLYGDLSKMR